MAGYEWFYEPDSHLPHCSQYLVDNERMVSLKSERSIDEDLSLLSIRSVSSVVGRTLPSCGSFKGLLMTETSNARHPEFLEMNLQGITIPEDNDDH
jgi:hypothetical protein